MPRRGSRIVLTGLCALTLAGAAGILGHTLRPAPSPELLNAAAAETSAPVVSQPFDDSRKVQVRFVWSATKTLPIRTSGTLTESRCVPDGSISSGAVVARIDDRPLIGLHTSVPLYRDISWGDQGADVTALQNELVRLGHLPESLVDGRYGRNTSEAVQKLRVAAGAAEGDSVTKRAEFVWLPNPVVSGIACEIQIGQDVSEGTVLATIEGVIERIEVGTMPERLTPGARTLTVNSVTGPVTESGTVDNPDFLARVIADTRLVESLQEDPDATITGSLALADEIDAYALPVGAIVEDGESRCVLVETGTRRVQVLGSTLGSAVVAFLDSETAPPQSVVIGNAITETDCA